MSLLACLDACRLPSLDGFRPFCIAGEDVGFVRADIAERLAAFPEIFQVTDVAIALHGHFANVKARSAALDKVARALYADGVIDGWRGELFPVARRFGAPPFAYLERAAVPLFGVRAYGVHLNGYVHTPDGIKLWIARRAEDRPIEPGKLDNLVAGGLPAGLQPFDNLLKEAAEEAAIPPNIARHARPAGAIAYRMLHQGWLRDDAMLVYDLALPADFVPQNRDGEIASFALLPLREVEAILAAGGAFKFNVALVVIDFMIRHGYLGPERSDYAALALGLWHGAAG